MAQETIQYNIKVNTDNSVKTLGQLEEELSQINEELKNVDRNTQAFEDLTKASQATTKELEKVNNQIAGITGEDKIQALDGSLKVLGGTISGVVGGLGLLGIESEQFGKFEEKAASAIALGIGIKDVGEGVGQLAKFTKKLPGPTKAAAAAQKAFNIVLKANPIGLVVLAISLVVAGFLLFSDKARDLIKKIKPLNTILEKTVGFFKMLGRSLGLVATEEEELAEATKKATDGRVKDLEREIKVRKAAGEDTVALEREKFQKLIALTEEGSEEQKNALNDLAVFEAGLLKKKQDDVDAANKVAADKRKEEKEKKDAEAAEDVEKEKEKVLKKEDAEKSRLQSLEDIEKEYKKRKEDDEAESEVLKIELEQQRALAELERLGATNEQKLAVIAYYNGLVKNAQDVASEEAAVTAEEAAANAIAAKLAEKEGVVAIEMAKYNLLGQGADLLADLAEGSKGAQIAAVVATQAAAIGQIISSTGLANAKAVAASPLSLGQPWVAINSISAGLSIASSINSARKSIAGIKSSTSGGGIGGGAPSIPGGRGGASVASTPTTSTPSLTDINAAQQISTNGKQEPVRAYVIAGEVTSAQEANARITQRRVVGRN
tara:strand:+ start:116 stop:1933 length:1818 start_codon:yes stop_codon:yes gene_type:complete